MPLDAQNPPGAAAAAALVAMVGPLAGQHATIILAALAGAMWPLASRPTATRREAALLLLRLVLTASALGGLAAWLLETRLGVPSQFAPSAAAWAIGAAGDGWKDLIRAGLGRVRGGSTGSTQ